MGGPAGSTVVKLGGSYAFSTHLKDWIDAIAACPGLVVVAPGGGPFADVVRMAQPKMGFDDHAAHQMALLAMDQYGCVLANLGAGLTLAASAAAHDLRGPALGAWRKTRSVCPSTHAFETALMTSSRVPPIMAVITAVLPIFASPTLPSSPTAWKLLVSAITPWIS